MNDNAKALVAALRSGDYKQGKKRLTQRLANGDELDCCLGVACKLYQKSEGDLDIKIERDVQFDGDGVTVRSSSKFGRSAAVGNA